MMALDSKLRDLQSNCNVSWVLIVKFHKNSIVNIIVVRSQNLTNL